MDTNTTLISRTVFIISDGTGITAETFSNSILSQFEHSAQFRKIRVPFIDNLEKAQAASERINQTYQTEGIKPLIFCTLVNPEISRIFAQSNAIYFNLFASFVKPLEQELGIKSNHSIGRSHTAVNTESYKNRIEAINFSLSHDDGQLLRGLEQADVILVGVSRCGKTPTSLYLAMQYAIKAANVPLIPEDFERGKLPSAVLPYRNKLFGLTIHPERLAEVRHERRPDSHYASIQQCRNEVFEAERLMRREGIRWLSTTTKSIEELATTIIQEVGLNPSEY